MKDTFDLLRAQPGIGGFLAFQYVIDFDEMDDTFHAEDGPPHQETSVTVVLRSGDGASVEVPLEARFGGWCALRL